jgi:hypothetical protein
MANLISDADRTVYEQAMQDVADTFARPITVWRSSAQTITNTNQDYDAFSDIGPQQVTYISESKVIPARIKYIDRQTKEFGFIVAGTNIDVAQEFQLVRIIVDIDGNEYIKDCEKITVDGEDFVPLTVPRPHGLFGNNFFTIYLKSRP